MDVAKLKEVHSTTARGIITSVPNHLRVWKIQGVHVAAWHTPSRAPLSYRTLTIRRYMTWQLRRSGQPEIKSNVQTV